MCQGLKELLEDKLEEGREEGVRIAFAVWNRYINGESRKKTIRELNISEKTYENVISTGLHTMG